jgi:hypothetical protein
VFVSCVGCVLCSKRAVRRADQSFRGVIIVCVCVCVCVVWDVAPQKCFGLRS